MKKRISRQAIIQQAISSRLQQARITAGYHDPTEFCMQHQLSIINYLEHESGHEPIKASTAKAYCKLLNISLRWLLLGEVE